MFSCGTICDDFTEAFCYRCNKYKVDINNIPTSDSCVIEQRISACYFSGEGFPYDDMIDGGPVEYICKGFESDNSELMESYRQLVKESSK